MKYQNNAINLNNTQFSKKIVLRARLFLARFLVVTMIASSFPFSAFSLDVSGSTGDEGVSILTTSGSIGDEGALPPVSGSTGDEGGGLPPSSASTGDEGSLPPVSGLSGDEGENLPPTSGSQGDGSGSLPPTSGSTGDEGALPPVSGSTGDEGGELPPSSGSTGDENGALPPVTGFSGDEGGSLPPTSGSTGDESGELPPISGSTGDEGGSLPPTFGSNGDEGGTIPPTSGPTGDEEGSLPSTSGSTGDEGGALPPISGSTGDEGGILPSTSGSTGDESGSLPSTSGSTGDEGGALPPISGSTGDEGGSLPTTSGSTGDEGGSLPPTSGSNGDEGGSLPSTSGSTGDEGVTLLPTSGSTGDDGDTLPPTSGSTGDEGEVALSCATNIISSPLSVSVVEAQPISYTFSAITSPLSVTTFTFALGGALPAGLVFDPATAVISGTPTQVGTFSIPVIVSSPCDTRGAILEITVTPAPIISCPVPSISSALSVSMTEARAFSYTFSAITIPASVSTFTFSLGSSLPTGLSFDSATGVISGVPTQTGTFSIQVIVSSPCDTRSAILVITVTPAPITSCPVPAVSSLLAVTANINQAFSYSFTSISVPATTTVSTFAISSVLPNGLTFSASTGVISGMATQAGTYSIPVTVTNVCGSSTSTLIITVPSAGGGGGGGTPSTPTPTPSGGGGGGGGGGSNLVSVSNPSVCQRGDNSVEVRWYTNFQASSRVLFGTSTVPTLGTSELFGYQNTTEKINVATTTHKIVVNNLIPGTQYFLRPFSGFFQIGQTEIGGSEVSIIVGAGVPCTGATAISVPELPSGYELSCSFLTDFMRIDFNNNPEQVRKLQIFLKYMQGYDVDVTGNFDKRTDEAVKSFQDKYYDEVLKPWGEKYESTGYVYITTKRKINEIVCGYTKHDPVEQKIVDDFKIEHRNDKQQFVDIENVLPTTPPAQQSPREQDVPFIIGLDDRVMPLVTEPAVSVGINDSNLAAVPASGVSIKTLGCQWSFRSVLPCVWQWLGDTVSNMIDF